MFSVVIPLFNKKDFIHSTITSVLDQTYKDFELIIVDDGSTDGSDVIAKSIPDPRISILRKPNGGVSSARNFGIRKSSRSHIAFLDADDLWDVNFLKKMKELIFDHDDCDIFASSYIRQIGGVDTKSLHKNVPFKRGKLVNYFDVQRIYFYPLICSSAVIIKKEKLFDIGLFNEKLSHGEDLDLWYRTILSGNLAYLNEPLAIYRDCPDHLKETELRPANNIVFNLSHYIDFEIANPSFRKYLNKLRLKGLKKFYLSNSNESDVLRILENVPLNEFSLYDWTLYKLAPKKLLRLLYFLKNELNKLTHRLNA